MAKAIPTVWNDEEFPSRRAAARAARVSVMTMLSWVRKREAAERGETALPKRYRVKKPVLIHSRMPPVLRRGHNESEIV